VTVPEIEIRPLTAADARALQAFFSRVPEGDRTFFREDVLADGVIDRWLLEPTTRRYLAIAGERIVGSLAIVPGVAWSAHVGEVRIIVDPDERRRGVGRALARQAIVEATGLGLSKLVVEVAAEQPATVAMFNALGFVAEGLLVEQVRSRDGELHDLLVLSHFVDRVWSSMATAGIDEALDT
jgi:L-amino acid N-acyltransferase YncA